MKRRRFHWRWWLIQHSICLWSDPSIFSILFSLEIGSSARCVYLVPRVSYIDFTQPQVPCFYPTPFPSSIFGIPNYTWQKICRKLYSIRERLSSMLIASPVDWVASSNSQTSLTDFSEATILNQVLILQHRLDNQCYCATMHPSYDLLNTVSITLEYDPGSRTKPSQPHVPFLLYHIHRF